MIGDLPPFPWLFLVAGAFLSAMFARPGRTVAVLCGPVFALATLWLLPDRDWTIGPWLGFTLTPMRLDALSRWFATIFILMGFAGGLFALRQDSRLEIVAAQLYAAAAVGVVLAGDVFTLFTCWELMALASAAVILSGGDVAAGRRYLILHLLGGVVLMTGLAGEVLTTGEIAFQPMTSNSLSRWLILAGFLLNAGAPPFSAWLPDAYPRASFSGMVTLSAFTTKAAVYALLRGFPGAEALIPIGLFMVFYGIVYAILENDMRRILAYSIVNQVGFMVTGIGIGTPLALDGAAAHAFVHIIYKALLLMAAGSVLFMTGRSKCTELGGLFRSMRLTTICGVVGALAISAFPLTSGFVTKSMIAGAAGGAGMLFVWYALAAASAGVFLHAGVKFPWFVFFQRDSGLRPADPPTSMRLAMVFFAALCLLFGVWPDLLYAHLPFGSTYAPYDATHVIGQTQLLLFSGLAFFLLLGALRRTETITLDTDWLYRHAGPRIWARLSQTAETVWDLSALILHTLSARARPRLRDLTRRGLFAETQPSTTMAGLAVGILALYVVLMLLS
jgi:multicomponent Na+:H+ antiporter subunit D